MTVFIGILHACSISATAWKFVCSPRSCIHQGRSGSDKVHSDLHPLELDTWLTWACSSPLKDKKWPVHGSNTFAVEWLILTLIHALAAASLRH